LLPPYWPSASCTPLVAAAAVPAAPITGLRSGGRDQGWGAHHGKIKPAISFHILRHSWASHAVRNGTPVLVVAKNLGHTDTRMFEKHYGHLAPSFIADAIRAGAPRYHIEDDKRVVPLQ
jgi:integrase